MKLTVLYNKKDIEFLLRLSQLAEEYFIEYNSYALDPQWEPESELPFSELMNRTDNLLVILSENSIKSSWIYYVLGYAMGKDINFHFHTVDGKIPEWSQEAGVSSTFDELIEYYDFYNGKWLEAASVNMARKTLLDLNLDITLTAFVEVVKEGDCMLAGIYLDAGFKATDCDRAGVPLICWAARSRKLPMIKLLMQAGADINAVSGDRNDTALIDAVSEDDYDCVIFLLQFDPDLEIESKNGQTALTIASGHNNKEIVGALVDRGANKDKKDKLGMSALTYAKLQNNEEILALLK